MGIAITFRHMASSDAVRDYVHEKLERVQKYLRQPLDAHVTFSTAVSYTHLTLPTSDLV